MALASSPGVSERQAFDENAKAGWSVGFTEISTCSSVQIWQVRHPVGSLAEFPQADQVAFLNCCWFESRAAVRLKAGEGTAILCELLIASNESRSAGAVASRPYRWFRLPEAALDSTYSIKFAGSAMDLPRASAK